MLILGLFPCPNIYYPLTTFSHPQQIVHSVFFLNRSWTLLSKNACMPEKPRNPKCISSLRFLPVLILGKSNQKSSQQLYKQNKQSQRRQVFFLSSFPQDHIPLKFAVVGLYMLLANLAFNSSRGQLNQFI